jgi:NDP-mannose synthase
VPDLEGSFLVMNGDVLTNLDYAELMRAHERRGAALTVAVHAQRVHIDLGVIDTEGERIVAYHEKPELDYEVSMGVYAYSEPALAQLPREGPCQFPKLVARLLEAGEHVGAYRSDAAWFDIGTPGEHERAVDAFAQSPELFGP